MPIATLDRKTINVRFKTNMKRIGAITTFLHFGAENLTPTGFLRSEGVRADILRAVLVFLHAGIEDFARSHLPRPNKHFTLSSEADIKRALSRLNIDSRPFAHLFPPLTQLAKRRHQIVHRADLQVGQIDAVSAWEVADEWQLIYWNLAVVAFYHRIRAATGPIGKVEQRALANAENGLVKHVEFGRAIIALKDLPTEQRMEGLKKLIEWLEELRNTLKLEVGMFLGPAGEPIEGAIVK